MASGQGSAGNVIAALCNVFIPGLGQLLQARLIPAAFFFLSVTVLYAIWWFFLLPWILGLILHVWSIVDAAVYRRK
jgi:hypothetical protein